MDKRCPVHTRLVGQRHVWWTVCVRGVNSRYGTASSRCTFGMA
ncbi:hypothetical protein [Parapedobacter sp. 2B3]